MDTHTQAKTKRKMSLGLISLLFLLPALLFYAIFELWPIIQTIWYSLYDWNGIDESTFVGLRNYKTVFTDPDLRLTEAGNDRLSSIQPDLDRFDDLTAEVEPDDALVFLKHSPPAPKGPE